MTCKYGIGTLQYIKGNSNHDNGEYILRRRQKKLDLGLFIRLSREIWEVNGEGSNRDRRVWYRRINVTEA